MSSLITDWYLCVHTKLVLHDFISNTDTLEKLIFKKLLFLKLQIRLN